MTNANYTSICTLTRQQVKENIIPFASEKLIDKFISDLENVDQNANDDYLDFLSQWLQYM